MQNYFIKHSNGGYCYFRNEEHMMTFISFLDYLVEQNIIQDSTTLENLAKLKSFCEHYDYYNILTLRNYSVYDSKSINDDTDDDSFENIQKDYLKLVQINELVHNLTSVLKKHKQVVINITNADFKKYLYDSAKDHYIARKEQYYSNKYNKELSVQNMGYYARITEVEKKVASIIEKLNKEYDLTPVVKTHPEYKKPFDINFDELLTKWQEILNEKGEPREIEGNTATDHFQKCTNYAIFTEDSEKQTGYWYQSRCILVPINEARLFTSKEAAQDQMKKYKLKGAIVEIDVNFNKVVSTIGNVDLSHLDTVVAHQEKEHIEQMDTKESLTQKLLALIDNNDPLKTQLENLLIPQEVAVVAKQRKKI